MQHKFIIFFLLSILSFTTKHLKAQEEIYDQPVQIIDTLNNNNQPEKEERRKTEKETAKDDIDKRKERLNRIRVGLGNFGLQFGTYTFIQATPTIGYMVIKNRLELGGGPILIYQSIRYSSGFRESYFVYGSDIYARGFIYKGIYLGASYDLVNKPSYFDLNKRLNVHHLLLGAGYSANLGEIGSFNASLMFNVLNNTESIYRGTFGNFPMILNVGFGFGLGGR
jgi:hypothetical protein